MCSVNVQLNKWLFTVMIMRSCSGSGCASGLGSESLGRSIKQLVEILSALLSETQSSTPLLLLPGRVKLIRRRLKKQADQTLLSDWEYWTRFCWVRDDVLERCWDARLTLVNMSETYSSQNQNIYIFFKLCFA